MHGRPNLVTPAAYQNGTIKTASQKRQEGRKNPTWPRTGKRKIDKWYTVCGNKEIFFEQDDEMFININSKEDIEKNRLLIDKLYG